MEAQQPARKKFDLPWDRLIQPAGRQFFFGPQGLENHSLDAALSPDGKWLAVMERYSIVFFDAVTGHMAYTLATNTNQDLFGGMNTYSGITWYTGHYGQEVFWSTTGREHSSYVISAVWNVSRPKRHYAHVQTDALVYSPAGFLWDNGLKHNKKVMIYGEASVPVFPAKTTWTEVYQAFLRGEKVEFTNKTTIDPVREILSQTFPSYGNHEFSDVMRADAFIMDLKHFESLEGDQLPELMIMALPNDYTAGTRPGYPTPAAMVTDNDVALGRIVEAISKSRFYENTVILVLEDDSQGGWDHISAFRTVGLVISPWSRLKKTVSTYYNQPSMVRTIEQILGLPPMNIQDAIAAPMADCFSAEPDFSP
jgi:hypothetical protein